MSEQKTPKIFIATPMYGGQCYGTYVQGLLGLITVCNQMKWQTLISMMFNESLITRARNSMVNNFLKTDATHLMFIDSDIRFDPGQFPAMVQVDKDIIVGIYPKKEINWNGVKNAVDNGVPVDQWRHHTGSFVINLVNYDGTVEVPMFNPVEVWQGGTGFMLIKREVFERMSEIVPKYKNDVLDLSGSMKLGEEINEFFATSIEPETGRLLSEDYHFCYVWRKKCEGKIYAAPWVTLAHTGTYVFEGQLIKHEVKEQPASSDKPEPDPAT